MSFSVTPHSASLFDGFKGQKKMKKLTKSRGETGKRKGWNMSYFAFPGLNSLELTRLLYWVARYTGIGVNVILSRDQGRPSATARHLFTHIARTRYRHTYLFIARFLNRSSHSTIKKSEEQANNLLETDAEFRILFKRVEDAVNRD